MTEQELVKALWTCAIYDDPDCSGCPLAPLVPLSDESKSCVDRLMERAAETIEELQTDRDTWKRRAEAAEKDLITSAVLVPCSVCKHYNADETDCNWGTCQFAWRGPEKESGQAEHETHGNE